MATGLHIGLAGWSYAHWNGVVYPKVYPSGFHPLEFLAHRFSVVEINTSFYQHLKPEVVRLWMKKVSFNPQFRFTAKLNRRFTHDRVLEAPEIAAFKEGLWPLLRERRLGAVLMQFPWSFRFTPENREFLIRLRRAFHEFPLAAEMRHASWASEDAIGTFLDYRIAFCNIDQPEYTSAMPPASYLTSNIGYVRLHGRNPKNSLGEFDRQAPSRLRQHDYLYSETELEEWAKRIERIAKFADDTFVIFNNDARGKSVVNALQLASIMCAEAMSPGSGFGAGMQPGRPIAPKELRRQFPLQLERMGPRRPEQQQLFPAA
jgi:uncharacterized protein YecE (DUF72 family)